MNVIEELDAKIADFLAGRYGKLTTDEIEEFREALADPDGSKWEREHAGEAADRLWWIARHNIIKKETNHE